MSVSTGYSHSWTRQEKAEIASLATDSVLFKLQYRADPVAFVHDCLGFPPGKGPTDYQAEILSELVARKRVAVRGPHGIGKTALAAWIVLWAMLTRDDIKVPTTASAWRQVSKFLWPEIHKWAAKIRWEVVGREPFTRDELLTLSLKLGATQEAFGVVSDNEAYIEGAHAATVVYIFDEAKIIPEKTWDAAEGAFSGGGLQGEGWMADEAYAFAISTPGAPIGRFYDIHARKPGYEDWWVKHVKLPEAIKAGRISAEWAEARRRQWGEKSAVYQNRVLGEFASSEEDGVIPLAWIERANQRWNEWVDEGRPLPVNQETLKLEPMDAVGVDVARSGEDRTVMAMRYGNIITEMRESSREDTMQTTGKVVGILRGRGGKAIVDVIGIGAGVVDRLREQGKSVQAFNASEGTDNRDRSGEWGFRNKKAAAWWNLREMLEVDDIALPPDDRLTGDLTAPRYKQVSGGNLQIESKEDVKKRLGRSTDHGDAVVMACWREPEGIYFARL